LEHGLVFSLASQGSTESATVIVTEANALVWVRVLGAGFCVERSLAGLLPTLPRWSGVVTPTGAGASRELLNEDV
jgi:hypothetical protein